MVLIVANGKSGVKIKKDKRSFEIFRNALMLALKELCMKIVEDAEGATKVISIKVSGASDKKEARVLGKKVANSILFKSAMYGEDINWGRIAAAIGSIDNYIDSSKVDISLGNVMVMQNGIAKEFDEEAANRLMHEKNIEFKINLNSGKHDAEILTNDITYEYIKINAFYKKQK
jgi:glutamate N-acetyltransferase/amino-acid N-acetyltransferase